LGLTKFADLTNEEYRSMFLGTRTRKSKGLLSGSKKSTRYAFRDDDKLPESVDWREKGAVVDVKDQGQCGELFCFLFILW
jgi:cathepsin L